MSKIYKNETSGWKYIKIDDILMEHNNIGNGTIAMKYFLQVAKELGVDKITGWLSDTDKDHWDRSVHFYEKFGFKVKFNEEYTSGSIELEFNNEE
ncbi:GNAT family N-acetyltransferase [Clostridium sp. JNZ X4-2]